MTTEQPTQQNNKKILSTKVVLCAILVFILGACLYATTIQIPESGGYGEFILPQYVALPLTLTFCGLSLLLLLMGYRLTPLVIAVIVTLGVFILSCIAYRLTQHAGPCYYDPNISIATDSLSHIVCPDKDITGQIIKFVLSPIITSIMSIVTLAGIGTLIQRLVAGKK